RRSAFLVQRLSTARGPSSYPPQPSSHPASECRGCNVWAALDTASAPPTVAWLTDTSLYGSLSRSCTRASDTLRVMTLAVANPSSFQPNVPQTVPIVVLGTDALLAASPSTPVQLAHACLRAGFANVIPASWGDELIASAVLRRLPHFTGGPAIQCSCPIVAHRLLSVGGDLRQAMIGLVPPPVAIARYVRTLSQPARTRITYVGRCPGEIDDSIDIRMTPDALLGMLAERQIALDEQPRVFESVIPPDRRRFRSQPGGLPSADALWNDAGARTLVEIDGDDLVAELAQQLLSGKNVL